MILMIVSRNEVFVPQLPTSACTSRVVGSISYDWKRDSRKVFAVLRLQYFERHGHTRERSSPLLPAKDPTLLFANAGMNQFKDTFMGLEKREYLRATSSQKCLRAGGKHNHLDEVGKTARHHTFFEMLGNFSFGDYFKEDAIKFAWDFLVNELKLDPERCGSQFLAATMKCPADDEAAALWVAVGARRERILRFDRKDNCWQMAETGHAPWRTVLRDFLETPPNTH